MAAWTICRSVLSSSSPEDTASTASSNASVRSRVPATMSSNRFCTSISSSRTRLCDSDSPIWGIPDRQSAGSAGRVRSASLCTRPECWSVAPAVQFCPYGSLRRRYQQIRRDVLPWHLSVTDPTLGGGAVRAHLCAVVLPRKERAVNRSVEAPGVLTQGQIDALVREAAEAAGWNSTDDAWSWRFTSAVVELRAVRPIATDPNRRALLISAGVVLLNLRMLIKGLGC